MRLPRLLLSIALLGFACSDKATQADSASDDDGSAWGGDADGADGGDGTSGSDAADGGDGDDGSSDGAPRVLQGDAWCYPHSTGESAWLWVVQATFDDPQGLDTVQTFFEDGVTVKQGGTEIARYAMTCNSGGSCSGSFNETADGVSCANASSYSLELRVVDEDDQWSAPFPVTGRQAADAGGR